MCLAVEIGGTDQIVRLKTGESRGPSTHQDLRDRLNHLTNFKI